MAEEKAVVDTHGSHSHDSENGTDVYPEKDHHGNELHAVYAADKDRLVVTHQRPYKQVSFWGTYAAMCLGALACYGGFVIPATSLGLIDVAIGPSTNIYWVVYAWTLCLAVGYTLVGRLSDIFGRRWFFIGAQVLATVGCIIGATANHINQLIAGNVLIGLAAAAQLSFNYVITELVPMRDRFWIVSAIFLFAIPFSAFGPVISRLLIVHASGGWRWDFRMNIIVNGLSTICYVIFYHPPNFTELHKRRSKLQEIKDIDFGGIVLFLAGFILFLIGLSWGGSLHPWKSAYVIAPIVVGLVVIIAFVLYEIYMPLRRPLVPMHLFLDREFSALTIISAVGGMLYYSLNVIYPTMVATLFTTNIVRQGLLSCAIGGGVGAGQFTASLWATPGGLFRWKLFGSVVACTIFTGAMAGAKTEATASALIVIASYFIGALESLAGVGVTLVIKDQTELGVAAGAYGSIRSLAGVIATAIFSSILTSKVNQYIAHNVAPALVKAGLPPAAVVPLLTALGAGDVTDAEKIPGVTAQILGVAGLGIQAAYAHAFKIVFLTTIAFGVCSCIAAWFAPNIEKHYSGDVMRQLHVRGQKVEEHSDTDKVDAVHHEGV